MRRSLVIGAVVIVAATYVNLTTRVLAVDPPFGGVAVVSVTSTLVDPAGKPIGTVQLHQDAAGVVLVRVDSAAIPAGAHGVHIHQTGKCEGPGFASAGGHFNPGNKKHGLNSADGPHGGDLAQIPATFDGSGTHQATTDRISLTVGPTSINDADGSALIVHAGPDDQASDPTGNSGGRIACAVLAAPAAAPLPPNTGTGLEATDGGRLGVLGGIAAVAGGMAVLMARAGRSDRRIGRTAGRDAN